MSNNTTYYVGGFLFMVPLLATLYAIYITSVKIDGVFKLLLTF